MTRNAQRGVCPVLWPGTEEGAIKMKIQHDKTTGTWVIINHGIVEKIYYDEMLALMYVKRCGQQNTVR